MNEKLNNYKAVIDGGRVKSAGFPMDRVFQAGSGFTSEPGVKSAFETARVFQELRSNASSDFRARFFPLEGRETKPLLKDSPALYRPILKTDQGAGKFLGFRIGENNNTLEFRVTNEQGYVIEEAYFMSQLQAVQSPGPVMREMTSVKDYFRDQDLPDARMAFERLEIEAGKAGLVFRREAQVGRGGLMFIHPARVQGEVLFPQERLADVELRVHRKLDELVDIVSERQKQYAIENGLSERPLRVEDLPFYFQADVHLFPDGQIRIAELQIPDVGLFLSGLDAQSDDNLRQVQEIVKPIKDRVIDGFVQAVYEFGSHKNIFLVTRSEVVENEEDVLEIRELNEVKKALVARGIDTKIISAQAASAMDEKSLFFIFNIDPNTPEFKELARAYMENRHLIMLPSPFMRVAERGITDYEGVEISDKQMTNLQALVGEVAAIDKPEKIYSQIMAVDNFLRQMGINEEVLHFYHPAIPTPIAAYRYDIRSLHIAHKALAEKGLKGVILRSIPVSPDRSVLFDQDGGALYATFRFMFIRS